MKLVVDASVLFSFFKKGGTTRELILDPELKYDLDLFAPVLEEVEKHIRMRFALSSGSHHRTSILSLPLLIKIVPKDLFELSSGRENIRPAFEGSSIRCSVSILQR